MKQLNIYFSLCIFLVFSSCEEEITFKGSELAQKLVVNCLVAADSTLIAQVKHSTAIRESRNESNNVNDAQVKLYENAQFIGLLTLDTAKVNTRNPSESVINYTLKGFNATAGNSYKLEVEAPKYEPVKTHTTIPSPILIERIDTSFFTVRESWGYDRNVINFAITFNDTPTEKNFYRIVIREKIGKIGTYGQNPDDSWYYNINVWQSISYVESNDLSINPSGSSDEELFSSGTPNSSLVFNDDLFDGKKHTITVFSPYEYPQYDKKEFNEYSVELHSISKEYYLYAKSLSLFAYNDGDPFAEPVQVYSNIENGYGIFGAYSTAKQTILDGVYPDESATYFYEGNNDWVKD